MRISVLIGLSGLPLAEQANVNYPGIIDWLCSNADFTTHLLPFDYSIITLDFLFITYVRLLARRDSRKGYRKYQRQSFSKDATDVLNFFTPGEVNDSLNSRYVLFSTLMKIVRARTLER